MNRAAASIVSALETASSAHVPRRWAPLWIPVVFLVLASAAIRLLDLDIRIQQCLWSAGAWKFKSSGWVEMMYHYGPWPAIGAGVTAGALVIVSFFIARLRAVRGLALLLLLVLVIGPGLVVNLGFKQYFGRPRPREVVDFGGSKAFLPVGSPNFYEDGRSFPSGHAAVGFVWFAGLVHYWRARRGMAVMFGAAALLHGGLLGAARMAQGAHWPTDILWAAGLVYLISWGLHRMQAALFETATGETGRIVRS